MNGTPSLQATMMKILIFFVVISSAFAQPTAEPLSFSFNTKELPPSQPLGASMFGQSASSKPSLFQFQTPPSNQLQPPSLQSQQLPPSFQSQQLPPPGQPQVQRQPRSLQLEPLQLQSLDLAPSVQSPLVQRQQQVQLQPQQSGDLTLTISRDMMEKATDYAYYAFVAKQAWDVYQLQGQTEAGKFLVGHAVTFKGCQMLSAQVAKLNNLFLTMSVGSLCKFAAPYFLNKNLYNSYAYDAVDSMAVAHKVAARVYQLQTYGKDVLIVATHQKNVGADQQGLFIIPPQFQSRDKGTLSQVIFVVFKGGATVDEIRVTKIYTALSKDFESVVFPKRGSNIRVQLDELAVSPADFILRII